MFGYLPAPCRCQIGDQVELYRSAFCGLCNALAGRYGQPARLLINRDSTFAALLAAAQTKGEPEVTLSARCRPWGPRMPVFESGSAPAFAAAVTLCGLQAKLEDERADEGGLRRIGARFLYAASRTHFDCARADLSGSGFPVAEVRRLLAGQQEVEAAVACGGDPREAAQPSARAFGAILAHTARLAGNDASVAPLTQIGRSLGELVYTLDAYEDLEHDRRRGQFNLLLAQAGPSEPELGQTVRDRAREAVARCQQEILQAWSAVELRRYRPVLEAVLLTGLPARTRRALMSGAGAPWVTGDEAEPDDENRDGAAADPCSGDRCDARCCDCCYCPSDRDCRCWGECCRHGCYSNDVGCRGGDCSSGDGNDCDCSSGGCGNCESCGGDSSGCPCCGGDCNPGDGSGCDCGNCDCSGCDCNCSN